jgi:hypothetical protein
MPETTILKLPLKGIVQWFVQHCLREWVCTDYAAFEGAEVQLVLQRADRVNEITAGEELHIGDPVVLVDNKAWRVVPKTVEAK